MVGVEVGGGGRLAFFFVVEFFMGVIFIWGWFLGDRVFYGDFYFWDNWGGLGLI